MSADTFPQDLPGAAVVRQGLMDLAANRRTVAACAVDIVRPRLSRAGLLPPGTAAAEPEPEMRLYDLLRREPGDAYARYNSLLRELSSFESALDHWMTRSARRQHT